MCYAILTFLLAVAASSGGGLADTPGYNSDVRSILADKCSLCHGPPPTIAEKVIAPGYCDESCRLP